MKNLILLPLIALIVLTGCKGNSFMTQRYTKLGHTCQKTSHGEKRLTKVSDNFENKKNSTVNIETVKNQETEEALVCSISSQDNALTSQPRFSISSVKTTIGNAYTDNYSKNTSLIKSETKNLKTKKTLSERATAAKGLIDSVLGLVVTIIVLVVVIVLVLFLVAAVL